MNASADSGARSTVELGRCLVTGGAGYLGSHLTAELARRGLDVCVFDRRKPDTLPENVRFVEGDLRRPADLLAACAGIDTVFHTAALITFLEFAPRAHREEVFAINVEGTRNLVAAAREQGVARLIHTSTNNVTFDGPDPGGDETAPYVDPPRDLYTATKILAEKAVLEANDPAGLLTCAIRPGGIFGPGEQHFLPRLMRELRAGRFVITIGDGTALSDNTFIDNLVDGQVEAALHLAPGSALGGQAYFITDNAPINYFEFFRPFIEGNGYPFPRWRIPVPPLYAVMSVWEWLHAHARIPPPPLCRMELRKVGTSHYYVTDKAKRDFGWTPPVGQPEATARCLEYCKALLAEG